MVSVSTDTDTDTDTVPKILSEMVFFISLLFACETYRWFVVKRRAPGSSLDKLLYICSLVLSWYTVSVTLILFNKWVLTEGLTFPTFYTTVHMCLKGLFALSYYAIIVRQPIPVVSARHLVGLSLAGSFAALDILLSNLSLTTISTSFYTFLKSASLVFVLIVGVITFVEPPSIPIFTTVVLVSSGMFLMAYGEAHVDATGVEFVLASEVFAALRWIVTQVLVQEGTISAMAAVLYMSPASTLSLVPLIVARELSAIQDIPNMIDSMGLATCSAVFVFPGFLSFLLLLVEVQLVIETSSLTLSVLGNLKSVVTIIFSVAVFGDTVSVLQWCGMLVAFTGMLAYSHARGDWLAGDAVDRIKDLFSCAGDVDHRKDSPPEETTPIFPKGKALAMP